MHEDKKLKRSKKSQKLIIQKSTMLFSKIISNEFFLSFAKTVITFERNLNLDRHHDNRAKQLLNELKKMRRQNQIKRMRKLTQSLYLTINDIIRNEYDFDTSKRSMQSIIFFIFINVRIQENFVDQMISQFSWIVNSSIVTSNIMFDLKRFLSRLEAIIFERDEIKKTFSSIKFVQIHNSSE
jgi:hypothetical protein